MEQQVKDDIQRVFQLQKNSKSLARFNSGTAERKASTLLDSVIAHEEEIIEAIRKDVRKPYHEVKKRKSKEQKSD